MRLFLGVDELKEMLLTEFKLMVPLAGFSLTLRKHSLGRDWGNCDPGYQVTYYLSLGSKSYMSSLLLPPIHREGN